MTMLEKTHYTSMHGHGVQHNGQFISRLFSPNNNEAAHEI